MKTGFKIVFLVLLTLTMACSREPDTGPGQVRWDKDTCARCLMSVSDRNYSAQVRGGPENSRTRLYYFDDFGCAVLWLELQPWHAEKRTEIWVTDETTGEWIDARTSYFTPGRITPMDYGLGAGLVAGESDLNFSQACQEVQTRENSSSRHPGSQDTPSKGTQ